MKSTSESGVVNSGGVGLGYVREGAGRPIVVIGSATYYPLDGIAGYIVLEREDPQALAFATFTAAEVQTKIEDAYSRATEELGI
jgi:hypothetical protein